jgi:UDP-GlcNAc:undecaprenyl-phosphate GlcNAc-1-phosphate transferase
VKADRTHLHHALMDSGLGRRQTLMLMIGYATLCATLGLLLERVPDYLSLLCYVLLFGIHCWYVLRYDRVDNNSPDSRASV